MRRHQQPEIFVHKTDVSNANAKLLLARDGMGNVLNRLRDVFKVGLSVAHYETRFTKGMPYSNLDLVPFVRFLAQANFIIYESDLDLEERQTIAIENEVLDRSFFIVMKRTKNHLFPHVYFHEEPMSSAIDFSVKHAFSPVDGFVVEMGYYRSGRSTSVVLLASLMNLNIITEKPVRVMVPEKYPV